MAKSKNKKVSYDYKKYLYGGVEPYNTSSYTMPEKPSGMGVLQSSIAGMTSGSAFGPWGTLAGAVIGTGAGIMNKNKQMEMYDEQMKDYTQAYQTQQQGRLTQANMKYGGKLKYNFGGNAEIEGEEVVDVPYGEDVAALNGGYMTKNSSSSSKATGNSHNEGGIDVNLPQGAIVFSDKLYDSDGKTFAEKADKITKAIGKVEKKIQLVPTQSIKNTLQLLEQQKQELFAKQETLKTPEQQPTNMKYGGKMKYFWGGEEGDGSPVRNPNAYEDDYWNTFSLDNPNGTIPSKKTPFTFETPSASIPTVGSYEPPVNPASPNYGELALKGLAYVGPVAQGLNAAFGKKQYSPRRINTYEREAINMLPTNYDINPALQEARAGLKGYNYGVDTGTGNASVANTRKLAGLSSYFSNANQLYGTKNNQEAQMKTTKAGVMLGQGNINRSYDSQIDDLNLQTDANARNIGFAALNNVSKIAQMQGRENNLADADVIKLAASVANMDEPVRKKFLEQLAKASPAKYQQLLKSMGG